MNNMLRGSQFPTDNMHLEISILNNVQVIYFVLIQKIKEGAVLFVGSRPKFIDGCVVQLHTKGCKSTIRGKKKENFHSKCNYMLEVLKRILTPSLLLYRLKDVKKLLCISGKHIEKH